MRQHVQPGVFLNDCHTGGQVGRAAQVNAAHAVAVLEVSRVDVRAAGAFHNVGGQPGKAGILLDVAVFCQKLGPLGQTALSNGDFFQQVADTDAHAQVRVCFRKLVDIVPLGRVVDHVEKRCEARLFGITQ